MVGKHSKKSQQNKNTHVSSQSSTDARKSASPERKTPEPEQKDQNLIEELHRRISALEYRVDVLESQLVITNTVNKHLETKIDEQQQYSRRPCLVVNGMEQPGDEVDNTADAEKVIETLAQESGISKEVIKNNVDKIHPIGKPDKGKQKRIVKFTTHNFKETIFKRHKNKSKNQDHRQYRKPNIKLQPSLTKRRIEMLEFAAKETEDIEQVNFVYADMHGNLKLRLHSPVKNKYVLDFKNEDDMSRIISLLGPDTRVVDEDFAEFEE